MTISDLYHLFTHSSEIVIDSRKARPNSIFFALKGDNFDGNDFARQAIEAGCSYAIVDRPDVVSGEQYIMVDDVLVTLQQLATKHRNNFRIPVIAITGTNGKTTTKELTKSALSPKYRVYATTGNLNNHIGVPLTLLSMPWDTEIAIIEMGANHPGEIAALCNIALPSHGVITNIGKAHLEGFGSPEGVRRTKKELYDFLIRNNGVIFYHAGNPVLAEMLSGVSTTLESYGDPAGSKCYGKVISASPYLRAGVHIGTDEYDMFTQIAGAYNLENILAAMSIGNFFEVPAPDMVHAIEQYSPQNNRSQIVYTGQNRLFVDYYNANPTSMKESLNNFFKYIEGKRMVILGDMFELGDVSHQEHSGIVDLVLSHPEVTSVVVGKQFHRIARDYPGITSFETMDELKQWLENNPLHEMTILIKGSRGMKLEQLSDLL